MPDISLVPVEHDPFAAMSDQDYYNASVAAGAQGGEGVPLTIQPGESSGSVQGPNQPSSEYATMKPYEPTIREKLIAALAGMSQERPSVERQRVAEGLANVVGLTPAGIPMAAQEMKRDAGTGHYLGAGLNAMAMIPAANIGAKVAAAGARSVPYTRQLNDIGLYSHAAETAAGLPQAVGTSEQFKAMLLKGGVKPAEIEAAGFDAAMAGVPKVTREDVVGLFEGAVPKLEEKVLGIKPDDLMAGKRMAEGQGHNWDDLSIADQGRYIRTASGRRITDYGGDPKFQQYTLPGGNNYRELLLKAPSKQERDFAYEWFDPANQTSKRGFATEAEAKAAAPSGAVVSRVQMAERNPDFKSGHWDDPNIVAHLRMSDRTNNGEKVLHLEELQSDWGQKGRKEGFGTSQDQFIVHPKNGRPSPPNLEGMPVPGSFATMDEAKKYINSLPDNVKSVLTISNQPILKPNGVPSGPYVTKTQDWTDLGLKRALKEAAEGGYDRLTWTPGAEQAKRYDLSKQIDELVYFPNTKDLQAFKNGKEAIYKKGVAPEHLPDIVGKEVAKRLLESPTEKTPAKGGGFNHTLSGQDLSVGGEGMKSYYDKIVPTRLKEIIKKLDPEAKIEPHAVNKIPTLSIRITPKMKEAIKKGLPAFAIGGGIGLGAANNYSLTPVDHDPFQVNILKRGI